MSTSRYEYLLPIFVGHPFQANYTKGLRETIQQICTKMNSEKGVEKAYFWRPEFLTTMESSRPQTLLETITEIIRQSALCLFEVTDLDKANVFFELGVAVGMHRALALLAQRPYVPPSDLQGVRRIEYSDMSELAPQIELLFRSRIQELLKPPEIGQEVIHQKMQIDANWQYRLQTVSRSIYFFAGDLSWAKTYADEIKNACERGVSVRICCRRPRDSEERKWENIDVLKTPGVEIKLLQPSIDPGIRGFIHEPDDVSDDTEVMLVEKQTRTFHSYDYERTGVTIGESQFLYRAHIYRANMYRKHVIGFVRLFETVWESRFAESYR